MSEKIHIPESEYVQLIRHIKELEAQLKLAQGTLRKWKIVIADYKAQLAEVADGSTCCGNLWRARAEKAEAQLARVQLALKTCQGNCTTHELNETKALEQLEAVKPYIQHQANCPAESTGKNCDCGLKAAIGEES